MNAVCVNYSDNFKSFCFSGGWLSWISPSNSTHRLFLFLICVPKVVFILPDGMASLISVARTFRTCMAQIEANSNFPQPGWFKESASPMIDTVKRMSETDRNLCNTGAHHCNLDTDKPEG